MKDFSQVMDQYAPMVSAIIRRLHIYEDHESFRQIGAIALWQAWERYDCRTGHFAPFAYRSIQGAMKDELSRKQRGGQFARDGEQLLLEEQAMQWKAEELPEWLSEAELSEKERQLLEDVYIRGYSMNELQQRYWLTLSGVKKRRERTLAKIRLAIDPPYNKSENN